MIDAHSGQIKAVDLKGRFTPEVSTTESVQLPYAYAVPSDHEDLLEVLNRQGFLSVDGDVGCLACCEEDRILVLTPSSRSGRYPRSLDIDRQVVQRDLAGYKLFSADQLGGHALAVLLEPRSKYGLVRHAQAGLSLTPGDCSPVLRVMKPTAAITGTSRIQ